jgi:hypothetical protein
MTSFIEKEALHGPNYVALSGALDEAEAIGRNVLYREPGLEERIESLRAMLAMLPGGDVASLTADLRPARSVSMIVPLGEAADVLAILIAA